MTCSNAIALFNSPRINGYVSFHQCSTWNAVRVDFNLYGLTPYATHACHIHEYGDERDGCSSLGGHWNPINTTHGSVWNYGQPRHKGDLINNIQADANGNFVYSYIDDLLNLKGDVSSTIIGRSVVVHVGEDDLGLGGNSESLKTGNAGARIACAIIGVTKNGIIDQ